MLLKYCLSMKNYHSWLMAAFFPVELHMVTSLMKMQFCKMNFIAIFIGAYA